MMEPSTRVACAHALVKPQISAVDFRKCGMIACLLNDALCGQTILIFVGWVVVVHSLIITIFVIASALCLCLPLCFSRLHDLQSFVMEDDYYTTGR